MMLNRNYFKLASLHSILSTDCGSYSTVHSYIQYASIYIIFRSLERTYLCLGSNPAPSICYLRKAWYSFSRLINVPIKESFICPICGPSPETIVCDGTMIGIRKDLIPAMTATNVNSNAQPLDSIKGSVHAERILVKTKKGRELLLKFSGYTKDRRCITQPQQLSTKEFHQLCQILCLDGFEALSQLIERIVKESGKLTASKPYRKFLAEIARNSPACGMIQIAGCRQACEILHLLSKGSVNIFFF